MADKHDDISGVTPTLLDSEAIDWVQRDIPKSIVKFMETEWNAHAHSAMQCDVLADAVKRAEKGDDVMRNLLLYVYIMIGRTASH